MCLHGFTGTPYEILPLANQLARLGYRVETPTLAGHGVDVATLEATGWKDWLGSAEAAFDAAAARAPGRIAVLGFSMGGLLALRLARSRGDRLAALVVLSAPLRLWSAQVRGIRAWGRLPRVLRRGPLRALPKLFGGNVADPEMRKNNPALAAMPFAGLESLLELMAEVRDDLAGIVAPALVAHGRKDRTVPIADSIELADRLDALVAAPGHGTTATAATPPATAVDRLWLERSRHLIGIDVERDILGERIGRFLADRACW